MTTNQCSSQNGVIVNTLSHGGCLKGKNIGDIDGTNCPCVCCVGENIVDCKKNEVKLTNVCFKKDELLFKTNYTGGLKIKDLNIQLKTSNWHSGLLVIYESTKTIQTGKFSKHDQGRNFQEVTSFSVNFKDYPLTDCRFPIDASEKIMIKKCDE